MTKSKTILVGPGRAERGPKKGMDDRIDSALGGFYGANPDIKVVAQSVAFMADDSAIVCISYEGKEKK